MKFSDGLGAITSTANTIATNVSTVSTNVDTANVALVSAERVTQFTLNLAQAAATYDICTATGGPVLIDVLQSVVYVATAGSVLTSVAISTNQTNNTDLLTAVEGAVAGLTAQKVVAKARTAGIYLATGQKMQFTIVGATGTGSLLLTLVWRKVNSSSTLV